MGRKTSFYYSFLVLPAEQRQAIIAVWDFCRAVDDAVDEPEPPAGVEPTASEMHERARRAICEWRTELARCYDGRPPETLQGRQLQPFITQFGLPRQAFDDVI